MKQYEDMILPYEFTVSSSKKPNPESNILVDYLKWLHASSEYRESYLPTLIEAMVQSNDTADVHNNPPSFQQFDAPLSLIMSACQFNSTRENPAERIKRIYVAQSSLSHLPKPLSLDLPTPDVVKHAGKGDIYSSSIWLGLQPTYTPLHRDPNPNLFCQLVGSKRIRLMTPGRGDDIYARVRRELGSHGSSRFRGAEMMGGRERELLHRAVWDDEAVSEVSLGPGDALFIPKGWWHSVASYGQDGELNSSNLKHCLHTNVEVLVWKPQGLEVLASRNGFLIPPPRHRVRIGVFGPFFLSDPVVFKGCMKEIMRLVDKIDGTHTIDLVRVRTECLLLVSTLQGAMRFFGTAASLRLIYEDTMLGDEYLSKKDGAVLMPNSIFHTDETLRWASSITRVSGLRRRPCPISGAASSQYRDAGPDCLDPYAC
ncbi:casein kinase 2 regulatory subunit [Hypoxylon texense]